MAFGQRIGLQPDPDVAHLLGARTGQNRANGLDLLEELLLMALELFIAVFVKIFCSTTAAALRQLHVLVGFQDDLNGVVGHMKVLLLGSLGRLKKPAYLGLR
ncbi:hypothetical protein D3C84_929720 [compost metagenome]